MPPPPDFWTFRRLCSESSNGSWNIVIKKIKHSVSFKMQRLAELYENEKKYVEKLSLAKKYGDYIERSKTEPDLEQMPEDFVGKEQFVFNNLDRVLKFHQNYILPEIEKAQKNPEEILNIFKNRKEQFKIHYGKFCSCRNRYSKIIVDFREYLQVSLKITKLQTRFKHSILLTYYLH